MTLDDALEEQQLQWIVAIVLFATFLTLILPFFPPHAAPLVLAVTSFIGLFCVVGIPLIRSLLPDRDDIEPEEPEPTREEKLKQQYVNDELTDEEFEAELDKLYHDDTDTTPDGHRDRDIDREDTMRIR